MSVTPPEGDVLAHGPWNNNAELIADVARIHLNRTWRTLDLTYGLGRFWTIWRPDYLVGCDLNPAKSPFGEPVDFRATPFETNGFDAVVFDGPYKFVGTSTGRGPSASDEDYGVEGGMKWQDRMILLQQGTVEACRLATKVVLVKVMDQVVSGAKRFQTRAMEEAARGVGWRLADEFHIETGVRPQPRLRQLHASGNFSTLQVYKPTRAAR